MTDRIYEAAVRWRELTRLVYASEARVFAVIGVHAAREVSQLFDLGLDGERRYAEFVHDGRPRAFVYLDHPSSGGKKSDSRQP